MADKVTLEIDDIFDDKNDGIISLTSNMQIYKVLNDVNDLYSLNTANFTDKSNIICYVKNVTNNADDQFYAGAFFKYIYDTGSWQQLVMGSHSHENKELLDKLCNLNLDINNDEYNIKLIKTDTSYDFKLVKDESKNPLPDLPIEPTNNMVLTTDGTKVSWTNNIAPAQTFKKLVFNLANYEVHDGTYINLPFSLKVSDDDELLIYDSGRLVEDITKVIEHGIIRIISPKAIFDKDDIITILVIRNGISGFLEAVDDEYVKKSELVEFATNGNIDLNKYVKKSELSNYSAKDHYHSEYALFKHNHDNRYAMAQHTHSEYMTRANVLALIADTFDLTDNDAELDVQKLVEALVDDVNNRVDAVLNKNYADKDYVDEAIKDNRIEMSNANNIYYNQQKLSTIIEELKENNKTVDELDSSKIKLEQHDIKRNLGGFKVGDTIYEGMDLDTFVDKLLGTNSENISLPELKCKITKSGNNTNFEVGEMCTITVKADYIKNDGAELTDMKLIITTASGDTEYTLKDEVETTVSLSLIPFDNENTAAKILITANYDGNNVVDAGTLTYEDTIRANRFMFAGGMNIDFSPDYTSQSEYIRELHEFIKADSIRVKLSETKTTNTILFAIPSSWNVSVDSIEYEEQGCDIFNLFEKYTTLVDGDNNSLAEVYNVYYYKLDEPVKTKMTFTIYFKEEGAL